MMEKEVSSKRPFWIIREYKKGDEDGILKLFRLGGIKQTSEEWLWKYEDNSFGNFIWVGEYEGQIIGHLGSIPARMKIGDRKATAIQTVDVIVHPKFRRQGMLVAMGKASARVSSKRGIAMSYGFPNRPTGHLKYGVHVICKIPWLVKFVNTRRTVIFLETKYRIPRAFAKIILQIFLITTGVFARLHSRMSNLAKDGIKTNVEIRAVASFDHRIDDFWRRVSRCYDIAVIRNRKYLNWRYSEKPNAEYKILLAERKKKILGYVVLRCRTENNLKLGYIVDILASSKNMAQYLVLKAIEHFRNEDVDMILCLMLKNSWYYKILRCNNFLPIKSTWFMAIVHSSWLSETFVRDYTKWYVTIGDSDYV